MRARTLLVLFLAIVCGGSAATGVVMMQNRVPTSPGQAVQLVVAARSIPRGQVITESMVKLVEWPSSLAPGQALEQANQVVGRTVTTTILAGEPVVEGRLAEKSSGSGIAALIPDGFRAYTIQTSRTPANVAGFVMPGHRVDVLLTLRGGHDDETGGGSSTTLLQAIEILAVNGLLHPPNEKHVDPQKLESVTLLVTPDQASLLDLGQNMGTLTLSLRNMDDVAESDTEPATVNLLRYTQREPLFAEVDRELRGTGSMADQFAGALASGTAEGGNDVADRQPRVNVLRPSVPDNGEAARPVASEEAESRRELPAIESIQTFRGRHAGRILVRSSS